MPPPSFFYISSKGMAARPMQILLIAGWALFPLFSAQAADGLTPLSDTLITLPVAGDDGAPAAVVQPGNPGDRGVVFGASTITVTARANISGGNGSAAGTNLFASGNGENGGAGGSGVFLSIAQSGTGPGASPTFILENNANVTGGNGGNASDGGSISGDGGIGGNGADGLHVDAAYTRLILDGLVTGGTGGNGGNSTDNNGGNGGNGGHAVFLGGANITLENAGTLQGGAAGGLGGTGLMANGANGTRGSALVVAGSTASLTNSGTITNNTGTAVWNSGGITTLRNNGTISTITGIALRNDGTFTGFDNTGGLVSAGSGQALVLTQRIATLTGGLFTSANVTAGQGSVTLAANLLAGGQRFDTIIENTAIDNNAVALHLGVQQSGTITNDGTLRSFGTGSATAPTGIALHTGIGGVNIVNNGTILGRVTNGGQNAAVTFTNNGTMTGDIALTGNNLRNITFSGGTVAGNYTGGAGADTLTFSGGTLDGAIDFGNGANNLIITQTYTNNGTITGSLITTDIQSGAVFSIGNAAALGNTTINTGGALHITQVGGALATGIIFNDGEMRIGTGKNVTAAQYHPASTGMLTLDATSTGGALTSGALTLTGGSADFSAQRVHINYIPSSSLNITTRSLAISGIGAASAPASVTDNSFLYDFRLVPDAVLTNQLYLQAQQVMADADAVDTRNNLQSASVLYGALANSPDAQIAAIQNALAAAPNRSTYNAILESTQPAADGGAARAVMQMTAALFDIAQDEFSALVLPSSDEPYTFIPSPALRPWIQVFQGEATQDARHHLDGYFVQTNGVAAGADTQRLFPDTVIGLALGLGQANLGSENANGTTTLVDSTQIMLYAHQKRDNNIFLTGMLAAGLNRHDQTRYNVGGIGGLDAQARYDSWHGAARAALGWKFFFRNNVQVTPSLHAHYAYLAQEAYTEQGAAGANLLVSPAHYNALALGGQIKASFSRKARFGTVAPEIALGLRQSVLDDAMRVRSRFAAGGPSFTVQGFDPGNTLATLGTALSFYRQKNWDIKASLDYELASGYAARSASVRYTYKF